MLLGAMDAIEILDRRQSRAPWRLFFHALRSGKSRANVACFKGWRGIIVMADLTWALLLVAILVLLVGVPSYYLGQGRRKRAGAAALVSTMLVLVGVTWLSSLSLPQSNIQEVPMPSATLTAGPDDPSSPVDDRAEIIYCGVIQDRVPRSECDYYEEIRENLAEGEAAIIAPDKMVRGEKTRVSFAITRDPRATPLKDVLPGEPSEKFKAKVARRMAAQLEGQGFTVEPSGIVHKDLFLGDAMRWDWVVTPLRARSHRLTLSAYVAVKTPEGDKENLIRTVSRDVIVEVPVGTRVGDAMDDSVDWMGRGQNWLKALGGLIAALGAVWLAIRTFGKPQEDKPA